MLESKTKQATNLTSRSEESKELDRAVVYCIYNKENPDLLKMFLEYHLNLGFKNIEILNYNKQKIDSEFNISANITIENLAIDINPQELINKKKRSKKQEFYSLLLKVNQFFHYQHGEYISIKKFLDYISKKNYRTIRSYLVPIKNYTDFTEFKLEHFSVNTKEIKQYIRFTKDHYNKDLIKCSHEALCVIFELDNSKNQSKCFSKRDFYSKDEIISLHFKKIHPNKDYENFCENQVLDNINLKEYLRNYLSPQKNKNKQYQKFLIYGLPRTGSNLICGILEKHKAISCHGEVFNAGRIFCNLKNSQGDAILKIFRQYNPLYFLKLAIWHNDYSESVKAVGFKALYNQLENFVYLKEYIFGLEDLKIIFLRRKNYLERIYSELLALQNNQWTLQNEEERDQRKLNIPFEKCKFLFEKEENFYINTLKILEAKNLPYLEIYYEDLNKNLRNEINKITRYSNLEDCNNLDTNLKKQNIKKLSEVIENYQDLKQSFANTKWELFFEE